jgi:hypothetical protein
MAAGQSMRLIVKTPLEVELDGEGRPVIVWDTFVVMGRIVTGATQSRRAGERGGRIVSGTAVASVPLDTPIDVHSTVTFEDDPDDPAVGTWEVGNVERGRLVLRLTLNALPVVT